MHNIRAIIEQLHVEFYILSLAAKWKSKVLRNKSRELCNPNANGRHAVFTIVVWNLNFKFYSMWFWISTALRVWTKLYSDGRSTIKNSYSRRIILQNCLVCAKQRRWKRPSPKRTINVWYILNVRFTEHNAYKYLDDLSDVLFIQDRLPFIKYFFFHQIL